ncbi:flagellar assembly peptidoglycan hydrolase FlgJ [Nitrogeniibacter mangrovi]|uniref:Peptidoglycan hydrolase FlgJ n=1 Tax=Nitrogeniibacter mangrovi TaxID=2016596 RepID=A0A6C1B6F9_9RHOO|nr:flagellar assembly peptidoglycan hydrolase FlgJ [Nitrogeniibacter mangrovi]QID18375.1 flagellar assembly peptidoglycan hydrolase FlgJ [Nitrogeniibacter mangrovi]
MNGMPINTLDPKAMGDLKRLARENNPEAVKAAARQFESLFLAMVLKTMRASVQGSGLMDNESTKLYQGLLDQQLAANMAASGGTGLANALMRQLGGDQTPAAPTQEQIDRGFDIATVIRRPSVTAGGSVPPVDTSARSAAIREATTIAPTPAEISSDAAAFVREVWPHAQAASRETGIPAHFMIAQAALETGWGKYQLRNAAGQPSHNLFNIKAGSRWQGDTVAVAATEYVDGRAVTEPSKFRAYGSYAESFRDYARLISSNPRYAQVLGQQDAAGFARELQAAGYATDPRYAEKLTNIINSPTLRDAFPG